jgi:hypothetical protein
VQTTLVVAPCQAACEVGGGCGVLWALPVGQCSSTLLQCGCHGSSDASSDISTMAAPGYAGAESVPYSIPHRRWRPRADHACRGPVPGCL